MAYHSSGYHAESEIYSSAIGCLDGIPFKINQNLIPPSQHTLSTFLRNQFHPSRSLKEQYDFDIEEGVLKWSEERTKQLEIQRQIEEERQIAKQLQEHTNQSSESDEEEDDWLKESRKGGNVQGQTAVSRPPVPPKKPLQPVMAKIGNEILKPVQIDPSSVEAMKPKSDSNVDVSLFEREEDPFDRYERQTLNELEELKNVFSVTNSDANSSKASSSSSHHTYENMAELHVSLPQSGSATNSGEKSDLDEYDNVHLQHIPLKTNKDQKQVDINKLPPIDQCKNFLAGKIPLPPIGNGSVPFTKEGIDNLRSNNTVQNKMEERTIYQNLPNVNPVYENVSVDSTNTAVSFSVNKPLEQNCGLRPTNHFSDQVNGPAISLASNSANFSNSGSTSLYENITPRMHLSGSQGMRNALSSPNVSIDSTNPWAQEMQELRDQQQSQNPPVLMSKTPPPRPSSNQSWNRYSPLPNPSPREEPLYRDRGKVEPLVDPNDPYSSLSHEEQHAADNLISMGFKRALASRAIQLYGKDEKEIIEFLCGVNKLTEKGFDPKLSETSLKIYKNDLRKAEEFLTLVKQFQELGFAQEKIQDALINHDLDRDKALDYLITV